MPCLTLTALPFTTAARAKRCDPNQGGVWLPIACDVDGAGGNGKGSENVTGPVLIIGLDIYKRDRDGDWVACET